MSMAEHSINLRQNDKNRHLTIKDTIICDSLTDIFTNRHVNQTAQFLCSRYNVSRKDQDMYAVQSHVKAVESLRLNIYNMEYASQNHYFNATATYRDELPREISLDDLANLNPVLAPVKWNIIECFFFLKICFLARNCDSRKFVWYQ